MVIMIGNLKDNDVKEALDFLKKYVKDKHLGDFINHCQSKINDQKYTLDENYEDFLNKKQININVNSLNKNSNYQEVYELFWDIYNFNVDGENLNEIMGEYYQSNIDVDTVADKIFLFSRLFLGLGTYLIKGEIDVASIEAVEGYDNLNATDTESFLRTFYDSLGIPQIRYNKNKPKKKSVSKKPKNPKKPLDFQEEIKKARELFEEVKAIPVSPDKAEEAISKKNQKLYTELRKVELLLITYKNNAKELNNFLDDVIKWGDEE